MEARVENVEERRGEGVGGEEVKEMTKAREEET